MSLVRNNRGARVVQSQEVRCEVTIIPVTPKKVPQLKEHVVALRSPTDILDYGPMPPSLRPRIPLPWPIRQPEKPRMTSLLPKNAEVLSRKAKKLKSI